MGLEIIFITPIIPWYWWKEEKRGARSVQFTFLKASLRATGVTSFHKYNMD